MNQSPDPGQPKMSEPLGGSGQMFDGIAPRYDLLNRLLSLGIDQRWRRRLVRSLRLEGRARVLDHATGTADLALMIAQTHPEVEVVGVDPSREMLRIGREKVRRAGLTDRIQLLEGDAEDSSHIPAASFDAACMAFGIRNVPDRAQALREFVRVLRPGGRIAILELSEPEGQLMGRLARLHVHELVPRVGGWLSGSREYRYLQQSIAAFPRPEVFGELMRSSGIELERIERLTFGVCHLYVGAARA